MCKHIYNSEIQYPKDTPFTYLIGWSKLNIFYYGVKFRKKCHPDDLWSKYFTSSPSVWQFRIDNGEPDIIKVDYIFDTKEEARAYEEYFLKEMDAARSKNWLNKTNGGKNFHVTEESTIKTANGNRGKTRSLESRKQQSISTKGKKKSPEHCKNISKGMTGRKQSEEHRKNNGASRRGKPGKKHSEETILKISNSHKGKTMSEDAIKKSADVKRGKFLINNGSIQFYVTLEEAEILYSFGFLKGTLKNLFK